MLNLYTVSFFGHRYIDSFKTVENILKELIIRILREHEYVEFLVGRNGAYETTQYALRCGKRVMNLADKDFRGEK